MALPVRPLSHSKNQAQTTAKTRRGPSGRWLGISFFSSSALSVPQIGGKQFGSVSGQSGTKNRERHRDAIRSLSHVQAFHGKEEPRLNTDCGSQSRIAAPSALEWRMQQTRTELLGFPRPPVEFVGIPAIHRDHEVRPHKTADDHHEKPLHTHRRDLSTPTSIRRFLDCGAGRLSTGAISASLRVKAGNLFGRGWRKTQTVCTRKSLPGRWAENTQSVKARRLLVIR
jgi:hypothetical protein